MPHRFARDQEVGEYAATRRTFKQDLGNFQIVVQGIAGEGQVDRIMAAAGVRYERCEPGKGVRVKGGQLQTRPAAGIRRHGPGTPGVGLDDDLLAGRYGARPQDPAKIKEFSNGIGPDDAALPEDACVKPVRPGQGAGMGEAGSPALFRAAYIIGHDRLVGHDGPRRFDKFPAPADAFNVERDNPCVGAPGQVLQTVHQVDIGFIAHTETGGITQSIAPQVVEHLGNEAAALGGHADKSGSYVIGQKGRIEPVVTVHDPSAVGTQKPDAVFLGNIFQRLLQLGACSTYFGESAGNDDRMPNALLAAGIQGFRHDSGGQYQYGQVRHLGQVRDGPKRLQALYLCFFGVHGVKPAGKSEGPDRIEDAGPHG